MAGQTDSQERHNKQLSTWPSSLGVASSCPSAQAWIKLNRPRGDSFSSSVLPYVGQCGRHKPHLTQSSVSEKGLVTGLVYLFYRSHAPALIVIHKSSQTGKSVISAGMPKSRPWTVTSRLCKRLVQATCQNLVSRQWIQGHLLCPTVCHPWTLDSGIPDRNDGTLTLVYNDVGWCLGTSRMYNFIMLKKAAAHVRRQMLTRLGYPPN